MDTNTTNEILKALFQGAQIANFEFWSEFVLRVQRDNTTPNRRVTELWGTLRIPSLFWFRLRSTWRVGDPVVWNETIDNFPIKAQPDRPPEETLQAARLMQLLGTTIDGIKIREEGELELSLSNGERLCVAGHSDWFESWFIELPPDDPDNDNWWFECDSSGTVSSRWPGSPGKSA